MDIRVEWTSDSSDCETCGPSYSEGANIYIDGQLAMEMQPVAHCFDGSSFTQEDVFREVCGFLGATITFDYG